MVMINDVARAFFEAPATRAVCVELPPEAKAGGRDMVGYLQKSLYGTRDAAANFQQEVGRFMKGAGFQQSQYSPSIYYHPQRQLRTLVHGDDFMTTGSREAAKWFKKQLDSRFSVSSVVVGNGVDEVPEARLLGRLVRLTDRGWELEADLRHAQLLIKQLNLEGAKAVKSPMEDPRPWEEQENEEPLMGREATDYRALAARANYLALDRPDIAFAAKECCRGMAKPTRGDMRSVRRLARYLIGVPRMVWKFDWQLPEAVITMYTDSDWAGCRRTARSTSGGVACRGSHCIKSYSVTQKNVTLSSAEAELMAIVKASSEGIGLTQLAESWGITMQTHVRTDSSAALAVCHRKGNGKLRHVRIGHLWVQEAAEEGRIYYDKIKGEINPADLLTKGLPGPRIADLTQRIGMEPRHGAGDLQLELNLVRGGGDAEGLRATEVGQDAAQPGLARPRRGGVFGGPRDPTHMSRTAGTTYLSRTDRIRCGVKPCLARV